MDVARASGGDRSAGPLRRLATVLWTASRCSPRVPLYPGPLPVKRVRRFASARQWYPLRMKEARGHQRDDDRPVLLFFSHRQSGPARRMASLVAWFGVTEKKRIRVVQVDLDANEELAQALHVSTVPTLVLLKGRTVLDRLDGRATGKQISRMISPHVAAR